MAVAFDATSNVASGTGELSWEHTPVGTPRGVLVVVSQFGASGADQVSGVTYGGVAMAREEAALLTTGGEQAAVYCYFLGTSVPTGKQTVKVAVSGAAPKRAVVYTLTGAANLEVVAKGKILNDSLANPSLSLAVPAEREAFIAGCLYSGQNATTGVTPNASYTEVLEYGVESQMVASHIRRTANTAGGATSISWTQTAENSCVAAVAIAEVVAAVDPTAHRPRRRPPIELDVEIETAENAIFRLSAEDLKASNVPTGITFTTQRGDGFGTASFTLARSILKDYPDLSLLDTVRFVGRQGDVAYEGRIHSFPRTNDPMHQINVSCVGWMTYLKSRPCAPLIIDRRLSQWIEPSLTMVGTWLGEGKRFEAASGHSSSTANPTIILGITEPWVSGARSAMMYASPDEEIGELRYSRKQRSGVGGFNFSARLLSEDKISSVVDSDTGTISGATTNGSVSGSGGHYLELELRNDEKKLGTSTQTTDSWYDLRVIGTHGLTARGSEPEEGYYVTDIGKYVTETYYPKIDLSEVEDNTFALTQFTRHDSPSDGYEIWQALNDLVLWELNMWEDRKLHFHPSDLSTYDWVLRTDDPGVSINWQGDSIENFANGVPVSYTDFAGITRTLWPDDHSELRDDSEDNPASRHGETLWAPIQTVPWKCLEGEALQWGRAYLAEYNRPKRPGSYRVSGGYLRDGAGHWRQGWQVRNSDTLGVLDHPQDFPRIITQTSWTQDGTALDVTVDALPWTISAVAARHELALQSRNLS